MDGGKSGINKIRNGFLKSPRIDLLVKNFQRLDLEAKGILLAQVLILIFCLFPWLRIITPVKIYEIYIFTPENVARFIILSIFFFSLLQISLFLDKLMLFKKVTLPFSQYYVYVFGGIQQFIFSFLAISALVIFGNQYGDASIKIGFYLTLICTIGGVVFTFLQIQKEKKQKVQAFFQEIAPMPISSNTSQKIQSSINVDAESIPTKTNTSRTSPINQINND